MRLFKIILFVSIIMGCNAGTGKKYSAKSISEDADMPCITMDKSNILHLVFARRDQLLYQISDDFGKNFSVPVLVGSIPDLLANAGRGPQITTTQNGICLLAPDKNGNIYSFIKNKNGKWIRTGKVNDMADIAKEGFVSVASRGDSVFAIWLDLRNDNHNKIAGALSADGGKTWRKNQIIYQSPDSTVCECCKPSVIFTARGISVMFRNWLNDNRDLYMIQSMDGANSFGKAFKLGEGYWKLNGCPMDGGGIKSGSNGLLQTVWRRMDIIYKCMPGQNEQAIGKGKNCTLEAMGDQYVYAWVEEGRVVCLFPGGKKVVCGEGTFPILQAINKNTVLCVWQNHNSVYKKPISF